MPSIIDHARKPSFSTPASLRGATLGRLALAMAVAGCSAGPSSDRDDLPGSGSTAASGEATGETGAEPASESSDGAMPGTSSGGSDGPSADESTGGAGEDFITDGNPFADAILYADPEYQAKVQSSIDLAPDDAARLEPVLGISTAIWIDRIAAIEKIAPNLDAALALQQREGRAVTTVFTVYDLPNRDCAASSSAGELLVAEGGIERYETEFIDVIAAELAAHPTQRIVVVLEPDSLPNIATNLSIPLCAESEDAYRESVAYAIAALSMPHVYIYLDSAHAGWLGWAENQTKVAQIYAEVLAAAGGVDKIRGFATNVSNYNVLDEVPEQFDYQANPCHDEHTFVAQLGQALAAAGITDKGFIIDTSRNGRGGIREQWGHWCNVAGAGLGERPRADPRPGIDAYYWVKPPGDSDGTSDPTAPRFDPACTSSDSASDAPQAGEWFHGFFVDLAMNANPALP